MDKVVDRNCCGAVPGGSVLVCADHSMLLLINRRNRPATISLPGTAGSSERYVNEEMAESGAGTTRLVRDETALGPFEVSVITMR